MALDSLLIIFFIWCVIFNLKHGSFLKLLFADVQLVVFSVSIIMSIYLKNDTLYVFNSFQSRNF